jgi:hypothetical protein
MTTALIGAVVEYEIRFLLTLMGSSLLSRMYSAAASQESGFDRGLQTVKWGANGTVPCASASLLIKAPRTASCGPLNRSQIDARIAHSLPRRVWIAGPCNAANQIAAFCPSLQLCV